MSTVERLKASSNFFYFRVAGLFWSVFMCAVPSSYIHTEPVRQIEARPLQSDGIARAVFCWMKRRQTPNRLRVYSAGPRQFRPRSVPADAITKTQLQHVRRPQGRQRHLEQCEAFYEIAG